MCPAITTKAVTMDTKQDKRKEAMSKAIRYAEQVKLQVFKFGFFDLIEADEQDKAYRDARIQVNYLTAQLDVMAKNIEY